jgi:tRNA-2-methylthio-N6-dimethylallyladenosine synthase
MGENDVTFDNYYIWTIGCQMNKADSERLGSAMQNLGLHETLDPEKSDVIVLNSCVVRQSAEDKVTGMINSLKRTKQSRPNTVLALMGCMVGPQLKPLKDKFPHIDVFMRPQQYEPLIDLLGERLDIDVEGCLADLIPNKPSVTSYVPVIHGCDEFCSFCIIPYRRGRQVSRPIQEIVREVNLLVKRGVKEITLLGQTVDAYGHDLPDRPDLSDLMRNINDIEGLSRIRFLTSHPNYMTDRIIQTIADLPKVCEHINLPFQAGDDQVLINMRRSYRAEQYRDLVEKIRNTVPNVSMSTDVIVGFPQESYEQFQTTLTMLRDLEFDKVHAAAYSPRHGTIAYRKIPDDVSYEDKKARLKALEDLQKTISTKINARLEGKTQQILVESKSKDQWQGRTRNDKIVYFSSDKNLLGEMVTVSIQTSSPWSLQGSLIQ